MSAGSRPSALRTAVLVWAIASVAFVLRAGMGGAHRFLVLLFVLWTLSPLVALAAAQALRKRWPALTRVALDRATWLITLGSLALYATAAWRQVGPRPAFVYVVVPLAAWVLVAGVVVLAAVGSMLRSRADGGR